MCFFVIFSLLGMLSNPQVSQWGYTAQSEDTFATYAYTFGDIVIFSYGDGNYCEILDDADNSVWSGILNRDEYTLQTVAEGVYRVLGSREFSVLVGDPFNELLQGWYAVDENARPLSTKLLTVIQGSWFGTHAGEEKFCVFAYQDNTGVTVKDIDSDTIIWEGDLDSAGYWHMRNPYADGIPVSVDASKPVSALSYGDCGYYAPAFNGTFTGRDFITFCGDMGGTDMVPWEQALKVIPWEDDVNVVVTDLDNPADTLWEFHVDDRGDVQSQNFVGRFLAVHADKDISCVLVPGTTFNYNHLVRCIDRDGLGLGTQFYIPVYQTTAMLTGNLDIFAFDDNTEVGVFKLPENTPIWSGTLQKGEHHRLMTEYYAAYKVEASRAVSVIESDGDQGGADFLPLWFAIHPAIAVYPDQFGETYPGVPVSETDYGYYELDIENNGNIWDVINMFTAHSDSANFTSELSDEYGGPLPDADGDGNPDTDTLPRGARFLVLVDVIPSDTVPVGTVDTCFFRVVSSRDTIHQDTAFLITTIISGSVSEKPVSARLPEFDFAFGQNVLYVSNPAEEELQLDFFDALGCRVLSRTIQESQASVDVSAFPKGVYLISAKTGQRQVTKKVVIR